MRTIRALAALALLVLPTACAQAPTGPAEVGDLLPAEIVEFEPDSRAGGYGRGRAAALSTEPITLGVFAGTSAPGGDAAPPPEAEPGRAYLVVTGYTHCRVATGVEVRRLGDDLRVAFTGGEDRVECARPYLPSAVLSLPAADVTGVRTVDGVAPVAAAGPSTLVAFVPLGSGPYDRERPVELRQRGRSGIAAAVAGDPRARAAMDRVAPAGMRAFAFLLSGCPAPGAALLVDDDSIRAELTGGSVECEVPDWYLATFDVPTEFVPPWAVLG